MTTLYLKITLLFLISFQAIHPSQTSYKSWKENNYTIPLVATGAFVLGYFIKSLFAQKDPSNLNTDNQKKLSELKIKSEKQTEMLEKSINENSTLKASNKNLNKSIVILKDQNKQLEIQGKNFEQKFNNLVTENLIVIQQSETLRFNFENDRQVYHGNTQHVIDSQQKTITLLQGEKESLNEIVSSFDNENKSLTEQNNVLKKENIELIDRVNKSNGYFKLIEKKMMELKEQVDQLGNDNKILNNKVVYAKDFISIRLIKKDIDKKVANRFLRTISKNTLFIGDTGDDDCLL